MKCRRIKVHSHKHLTKVDGKHVLVPNGKGECVHCGELTASFCCITHREFVHHGCWKTVADTHKNWPVCEFEYSE